MKTLKLSSTTSIIILIIFFGAVYFFGKPISDLKKTGTGEEEIKNEQLSKLVDLSLVEERKYNEPDTYSTFEVTYPQFKNTTPEFNDKIKNDVLEAIANQKKESADNWKARFNTKLPGENLLQFPTEAQKFDLIVNWEPVQLNDKFISIVLNFGGYTGGAHGYENTISYNYDVLNKKEVVLGDLFPSDLNYLKTLSDFSRKELEIQFQDDENYSTIMTADDPWLQEGTMPTGDNFKTFTFTPSVITIYFAQYQVGPRPVGAPKVDFSRK